jgi:hypothetical protein
LDLTIILTVGKYAILVAIYAFVLVVFRGIIKQLAAESRRGREEPARPPSRSRRAPRATEPARTVSRPQPAPEARAEPAPPQEPAPEPEPAPEELPSEEAPPEPAVTAPDAPPRRSSRIDLLSEPAEVAEAQPTAFPEPELEVPPVPEQPAPAQESAAPHLLVLESGGDEVQPDQQIPLSAAVTIGRSEENSLQVSDRFISSRHAVLCLRDGRRILVDRDSTNGTFVNGERVEDEVELAEGDRIALGNTVLEYHEG